MSNKIPGTSFTPEEEDQLLHLLSKVRQDKCRWPTEASMRAAHRTVSYWAVELVVMKEVLDDKGQWEKQILLAAYDGGFEGWKGSWHIPGGFNNPIPDDASSAYWGMQTIQPVASRVAKREIGVDVVVMSVRDIFWWPRAGEVWDEAKGEHPYGCPLSIYVECALCGELPANKEVRFFPVGKLPTPMVVPHGHFVMNHFRPKSRTAEN